MRNFMISIQNLKLAHKIVGMLVVTLVIMSMSSVFGIVFLTKIGAEIQEIAEEDLPLIEVITEIEAHQYE